MTIRTCSSTTGSATPGSYHNNRDGTFTNVTKAMGIDGPTYGFSCWAWDYDNDGWLDIFATCYDKELGDVIRGMLGQPHSRLSNRLWHNVNGKSFENKTKEAGLDQVFSTMGSNFADFDNDGWLDFYLATGATDLSFIVPNRMFKNVAGRRFADISASSGTGHLQKGHSISCADWDRDGDIDFFMQVGGAVVGDSYHNMLFQNPGQGNNWLTVKLVGKKTNRAAIGARIKVVTAGEHPLTIYRHDLPGQQLGVQPAPANHRRGQGRQGRPPGDPLADQRDDPGLPRHRRQPGHRGDRIRAGLPEAGLEADPGAEISRRAATPLEYPGLRGSRGTDSCRNRRVCART